jgi:hypothetical protein
MPEEAPARMDYAATNDKRSPDPRHGDPVLRDHHPLAPSLAALAPGGHLSVTRFECPTRATVIVLRCLHSYVKREVLRKASGCLGITTLTDWRSRTMYSISMWRNIEDIYRMGEVHRHVLAARVPGQLGVHTEAGIFTYVGDWRRVLFNSSYAGSSPITGWAQQSAQGGR